MALAFALPDLPMGMPAANENAPALAPVPVEPPDLDKLRRWFRAYVTNKEAEIAEAAEARRYYHSKQWTDAEIAKLKKRRQAPVVSNRVQRKVDFLVGVEQRMRRDPKAFPRNPSDEKKADVATAALRFVADDNRWEHVSSDAMLDGLVDGIGVAFVGIKEGRQGKDVVTEHTVSSRFFYDPRSVKPDFSDGRYRGVYLWMDIEDAKDRYPGHDDELDAAIDRGADDGSWQTEMDLTVRWADFEKERIRVVEMWYRERGEWKFATFTGNTILEHGTSPYIDEDEKPSCPYIAWSPYIDELGNRYGVVRVLKWPQDEINHRRSKLLHQVSTRQIHLRTGSVGDIDKFRSEAAKPDGLLEHEGEWGKEVGLVETADMAQGQAELLAEAKAEIENLGPNPGLIGKGGGVADQSGRAILAQRDSGMTELSPVFQRHRDWKLRIYRAQWCRIRQAWTGERWIRVTEDQNSQTFVGVNNVMDDPMRGPSVGSMLPGEQGFERVNGALQEIDVDIILDEGPDVMVMQEELMQTLAQSGAQIPPKVFIELSNTPNKERLIKMLDEAMAPPPVPPEIQAMQQRMALLEAQLKEATVAKTHAEVENKRADTVSKLAQVMVPPQAMTQAFPVPFADMSGAVPMPQQQMPMGGDPMEMQGGMPMDQGLPPLDEGMMPGGLPIEDPFGQQQIQ